ncbi:MazG nucleotide pyrophosphohydrolase domain-containing protein [Rhodococcus sp. NPDC059234]|uniref:MazG nucleotide pyrophosphohydrolase domain-containing protein n=1 Tax=Rhodococcus sp. NPDC059234 TaxID=3346781 RepID=UPI00366CE8DC
MSAGEARPGEALLRAAEVMDRLWGFGGWEVTQTHASLTRYLVEETYEVLDAVADGDPQHLRDELGDLLLQVLFHSRIASAAGEFDVDDVADALVAKLTRRSPHLADEWTGPVDVAEQERAWERAKAAEHSGRAARSVADRVARSQPPCDRAAELIARARDAGLPADAVSAELTERLARAEAARAEVAAATDRFEARLRAAEVAARAAGVTAMTSSVWLRYLGDD